MRNQWGALSKGHLFFRSKTSTSKKLEIFDMSSPNPTPPPGKWKGFSRSKIPKNRGRNPFPLNTHSPRLLGLGKLGSIFLFGKPQNPGEAKIFLDQEDGGGVCFLWILMGWKREFSKKRGILWRCVEHVQKKYLYSRRDDFMIYNCYDVLMNIFESGIALIKGLDVKMVKHMQWSWDDMYDVWKTFIAWFVPWWSLSSWGPQKPFWSLCLKSRQAFQKARHLWENIIKGHTKWYC